MNASEPVTTTPPRDQRRAEQAAETMLSRDAASQSLGITLEQVTPGHAHMSMRVRENMVNGHNICHGGFLFTLADSTFAVACNSYNRSTVAASAHIEFLKPARLGDVLHAEANVRSRGRRTGIYDVSVVNDEGDMLALFRGRSHSFDETLFDESLLNNNPPGLPGA